MVSFTSRARRLRAMFVFTLLASVLVALPATSASAATSVFINEIHYDNTGTDTGEAIEVAGPAGTDLTGWSLVRYNGANGLVYGTDFLSGTLPDQGAGFGTTVVTYAVNGLQNGAPDGVALVDAGSAIVQFLSYEGTFAAVDGPAAGMTSTDIGVAETGSEPIGQSLQLTGTGTMYEDFTWAPPQLATFGAFNTGQSFGDGGGTGTPDIVISEIMYNPASAEDDWEWVEVVNVGDGTANLSGWVIDDNNSVAHSAANIAGGTIPAGGSAVLYNADDISAADFSDAWGSGINLIAVANWGAMALNNSGDRVGLWDSFAAYSGDNVAHANAIEDVAFDDSGDWPADDNAGSIYLTDLAADNNVGTNWDLSDVGDVTPVNDTYQSVALGGNSGSDVGSPSANPPTIIVDPFGACGDPATLISDIQGSGLASPDVGNIRTIEGVVVGDFDGTNQLGGVFVQEEDADTDGDPLTSEGIFVFKGGLSTDVSVGDLVRVRGSVTEFFDLTELTNLLDLEICSAGATPPTPADITFPVAAVNDLESFEGMSILIEQQLHVTGNFTAGRFGEVDLSINGPLDNPTNVVSPGAPAIALQDLNDRSRIQLDDGSTVQNPVPVPPYFAADGTIRTGDTVDGALAGVLSFGFGVYEVQPTGPVTFVRDNPRPPVPDVGGSIQVGAFNVLNYFTTIDTGQPICGPDRDQGCRGADSAEELADQRAKIVSGISQLDAEVLGLMEIENAPDDTPTADLVAGLNDALGAGTYDYIATGAIGIDAIRLAILYQPGEVTPVGDFAILDATVDSRFNDERNRPALAQTFRENATGETFTVIVNHLKSKGSPCDDIGDPDIGDGQGNCNLTRLAAAEALAAWALTNPTGSTDPDFIITGDLNSYAMEDPIVALEAAGWTDLIETHVGTGFSDGAYSFNFRSQSGYLDHALANPSLAEQVTGAAFWHVNADEPAALDYNNFNQDELFQPDQFRSSDHDPVLVGLELDAVDGVATATPHTLWPPNHKYRSVEVTAVDFAGDPLTVLIVSVTSSEADSGLDPEDLPNDIVITGPATVDLRAERFALEGRTYTITALVTSDTGQVQLVTTTVLVPHDQRRG